MTDPTVALHMYMDETDSVIAESLEDAIAIWEEQTGDDYREVFDEDPMEAWAQVPDDRVLKLNDEDDDGQNRTESRTAAQWCTHYGRGYFGSTEY